MHLLDVNMLIALCDPLHVHHTKSRNWFKTNSKKGWATCPITENGFVRIVGQKAYPNGPQSTKGALAILKRLISLPGHQFWTDNISVSNEALFGHLEGVGNKQLTDCYLLCLAASKSGKLISLDKRVQKNIKISHKNCLTII